MSGKAGRSGGHNRTKSVQIDEDQGLINVVNPERVSMPDFIKRPQAERNERENRTVLWHNRVSRLLEKLQLTDDVDSMLVTNLAIHLSLLEDAYDRYAEHGMEHRVAQKPIVSVINDATVQINAILDKFGLLPKQRHKIVKTEEQKKAFDEFDLLMQGPDLDVKDKNKRH